jgi:CPA2 family monovalent cation:H+ antiporter-2
MAADPSFFQDLAYVFLAAVIGGGIARLARQPMVLGYVLGGILVSPLTPGPAVSDIHTFELFAEIGVVLLMFSIGVEFSLRDLLRVKWVAVVGGPLGILLSIALGLGVGAALGWPPIQGLVVGAVTSVASTMVLVRLLVDRGELHSRHGRVMIGITLVEDLAVVVLTVLMPTLGSVDTGRLLAIGTALAKSALILVPFGVLAARITAPLLTRVARTRSQELFLLVTLALGLGTAALTQAVGLSVALGAFLAGLLVSESDYAHEISDRLAPLRDAFVAVFFVTLGVLIDPRLLVANLPLLGAILALVVVGKLLLWAGIVRVFGYPARTALLVGVGLTQIGEFSFVLVQAARAAGHVGAEVYSATLAAALVSILVNAVLVRVVPRWLGRAGAGDVPTPREAGEPPATGHVVLCGFGRVGSAVGEALDTFRVPAVVLESDPDVARSLRARGVRCLFGDAAHVALLEAAGVRDAALVVLAIPDSGRVRLAIRQVRALNPTVPVLARAHHPADGARLRVDGATVVIQPETEAAAALIRHALDQLGRPADEALAYLDRFRSAMGAMADTAGARPGLPEIREAALPGGPFAGRSLRDAGIRERFGVTVVAITRADGELLANPVPETLLHAGDLVRLFGLPQQIDAFQAEARRGDPRDEP